MTYYGPKLQDLWSGTPSTLYQLFINKIGYNRIRCVNIFPPINILYQKLLRFYSLFFYTSDGICREKQIYKLTSKQTIKYLIDQKFFNNEKKWVLFVAEHCLNSKFPKDLYYAAYIDTDFPVTAQFDVARTKLGFNYYIKNYNKYSEESYKYMNIIFTQNEWTRQSIISRFNLDEKKVINVGFGVNIQPYYGEKDYNNELLLIVLRQHNAKTKGLDMLIEAFKILRLHKKDIRLAIVGNDFYKDIDGVDVYLNQPRKKTQELFQNCTLYTMPSRNEPNGITYLEALCNKAPIVGLNRFSLSEFTNNGEWGFMCKNEDPIELANLISEALSDKLRLKEMGLKGQNYVVNNFVWEKVVDSIIDNINLYGQD